MKPSDNIQSSIKSLHLKASTELDKKVNYAISSSAPEARVGRDFVGQPGIWRMLTQTTSGKLALAASIVIVILGGVTFWPSSGSPGGNWWLSPPAAWGQEIISSLEKVEALVHRTRTVFVMPYGSTHTSGTWRKNYESRNASRTDTYYDDRLSGINWTVPDGNGAVRYDVSFEYECYTIVRYEDEARRSDPVGMLRFYVGLLDKADRILGVETFDGHQCVGFEISAGRYADNPKEWIDRIWFDTQTKLPVRIEKHGRPITDHPEQTCTTIDDQFEYYVQLPADMFTPQIPQGFANTHPDQIRLAREKQEKGEMVFASVPAGLKEQIIAALNSIETTMYRQESTRVYLSRNAWREDVLDGADQIVKTEWYVIEKQDPARTSLVFNDRDFRLIQTIVDFQQKTYTTITHRGESHPKNPMDLLLHLAGYVDKADRVFDKANIDGIECFGIELSAKKYGSNPDGMLHRMWFAVETKLPVRVEFESPNGDGTKSVLVEDQFQWNPELPPDTFVPQIPADFTFAEPKQM